MQPVWTAEHGNHIISINWVAIGRMKIGLAIGSHENDTDDVPILDLPGRFDLCITFPKKGVNVHSSGALYRR